MNTGYGFPVNQGKTIGELYMNLDDKQVYIFDGYNWSMLSGVGPTGMTGPAGAGTKEELDALKVEIEKLRIEATQAFRIVEMLVFGNLTKPKYVNLVKLLNSDNSENVKLAEETINAHRNKLHGH